MPLYEYDCQTCEQPFEKRVSMSHADEVTCPECGSSHTKRRLSRIAVKAQTQSGSISSSAAPTPASGGL